MKPSDRNITTALRRHGYKLTPQRCAVVHAITSSQDHLTPTAIFEKVSQNHPGIGLVTVYRTLKLLAELELICELHTGGNCPSYTAGTSHHHHHLVCSGCGKVVDFASPRLIEHNVVELEGRLSRESGFRIDDHLLEFTGLCQLCQKAPASSV
ncbi:MAG: transcriptional repressor [Dehalococcoidales bacterium]|nr:MAG: transcriptional repressor [Dehalococcoidales bacterium]